MPQCGVLFCRKIYILLQRWKERTDSRNKSLKKRLFVVVEINLGGVIVIAAIGRKFNAVARVVVATMVAAVVGYNVLTTSTMAENYRKHTTTTCHQVYGKNQG